ncbi:hypothetical protein Tco_1435974 [Tanacetum coccineum]
MEITATIDGKIKIVTEASIRRHFKLENSDGISNLPTTKIFEQLALMGSKKIAWEQFSSNIATAIICLATNRKFNFSKLIFDGMVKNLDNKAASTCVDVRHGGAATTITSLDTGQGSGAKTQGRHGQDMEFETKVYTADNVSTARPVFTADLAVTTASVTISNASPLRVSTANDISTIETLVYIRRSASKDKAAVRLQVELKKEERQRIFRVHKEASSFNVEEWENVEAIVEADEEITARLQVEEQGELTIEERSRLFVELMEKKKKYFAAKRAKERRNKPLIQA